MLRQFASHEDSCARSEHACASCEHACASCDHACASCNDACASHEHACTSRKHGRMKMIVSMEYLTTVGGLLQEKKILSSRAASAAPPLLHGQSSPCFIGCFSDSSIVRLINQILFFPKVRLLLSSFLKFAFSCHRSCLLCCICTALICISLCLDSVVSLFHSLPRVGLPFAYLSL